MTIFLGLDIETTGLLADDHRIIEVYAGHWNDTGTQILTYEQRIDPQRAIAADAQRVHGISGKDLIGMPTWPTVAPALARVIAGADLCVAHNGDEFDWKFLKMEYARIGVPMPKVVTIDTMLQGIWATPDGKKPRLAELAFACGIPYDPAKAHAAAYDVQVMMQCFFVGLREGFYALPNIVGIEQAA